MLQIYSMNLIGMVKHSQISQNCMFAMSIQYLRKEVRDEIDFLHEIHSDIFRGSSHVRCYLLTMMS